MFRSGQRRTKPITVSFSGIDGAGKSTQIEILRSCLIDSGYCVRSLTFWDDVAWLTGLREFTSHKLFHSERGVGSRGRPVRRRDKNVRSRPMTAVRFCLYFLDALSLTMATAKARMSRADVIIFDRHVYDELANLPLEHSLARLYARSLLSLVPSPDLAFLLDADPSAACERKPEYPLDFLQANRSAYLQLGQIGGMTVIAPGSAIEVSERVMRHFLRKLTHTGQPLLTTAAPCNPPAEQKLPR